MLCHLHAPHGGAARHHDSAAGVLRGRPPTAGGGSSCISNTCCSIILSPRQYICRRSRHILSAATIYAWLLRYILSPIGTYCRRRQYMPGNNICRNKAAGPLEGLPGWSPLCPFPAVSRYIAGRSVLEPRWSSRSSEHAHLSSEHAPSVLQISIILIVYCGDFGFLMCVCT